MNANEGIFCGYSNCCWGDPQKWHFGLIWLFPLCGCGEEILVKLHAMGSTHASRVRQLEKSCYSRLTGQLKSCHPGASVTAGIDWRHIREPEFLFLALIHYYTWGTTLSDLQQKESVEAVLYLLGIAASIWCTTLHYPKSWKSFFPKQFQDIAYIGCIQILCNHSVTFTSHITLTVHGYLECLIWTLESNACTCHLGTQLIMHVCTFWNQLTSRSVGFLFTLKYAKGAVSNSHFFCHSISS